MKKSISLLLVLTILMSTVSVLAAGATELIADGSQIVNEKSPIIIDSNKNTYPWNRNDYIGFPDVNMSGIKSVTISAKCLIPASSNSETIAIMLDSPFGTEGSDDCIGYIVLNEESPNGGDDYADYSANIEAVSGVHDLYFVGCHGSNNSSYIKIRSFKLNDYEVQVEDKTVDDSYTFSTNHTTWALTDELGRKVADYSEAGPVKEGKHDVGILYWNWFTGAATSRAYIPGEIIKKYPSEKDDYTSPVWDTMGKYWWAEPLFGFYDSLDYWVYRRHAEMLANAGVDFIAFDYSNSGMAFIMPLTILAEAFRDAKKDGIKAPKITAMTDLGGKAENSVRLLQSIYFNCFVGEDYSDIWYYLDGKPLLYGNSVPSATKTEEKITYSDGTSETLYRQIGVMKELESFFTYRNSGARTGPFAKVDDRWIWLEDFPIHGWNWQEDTGRYEFCAVGTGINESYIYKLNATGVFSDEYTKGRGYSEAFGEDRTEDGMYMAYFFRDQASMALEMDPEIVMIDGWNEWTALRNGIYNGFTNSFVDTFDDENSRDFEPSAGLLRDHYYCLMIDFIRKYKGVEKAPVAPSALTVDMADFSDWEDVSYEYLNYPSVSRTSEGYIIAPETPSINVKDRHQYTYSVYNSIVKAKVSYDEENIYFLAETKEEMTLDTPFAMQLYIDIDRNKATGWNGYDYALNVDSLGKLYKNEKDVYSWKEIGEVTYGNEGNKLSLSIPRETLGEEAIDFEFKWTDDVDLKSEFLNVYKGGSTAPFGRYNYIFTEFEQVYPGEAINANLEGNAVLKAGVNKMTTGDSLITVYEPDTRITPVYMDGTLYVPEDALHEIIGYGKSKSWYDATTNTFRLMTYSLTPYETSTGITKHSISNNWLYTEINSGSMHIDGNVRNIANPVKVINGIIFVPLTLLADAYSYNVVVDSEGVAVVTKPDASALSGSTVSAVLELLE